MNAVKQPDKPTPAPQEPPVVVIAPDDWYARYERTQKERRRALLREVRAIEEEFAIGERVPAVCPQCQQKWNKKAG